MGGREEGEKEVIAASMLKVAKGIQSRRSVQD